MIKVKIFTFKVSNAASAPLTGDLSNREFMDKLHEVCSDKEIEDSINNFIENNVLKLIDIKINTVDVKYHNNSRGNTINLVYTLVYDDWLLTGGVK